MIIYNMPQRTPEWIEVRRGKITGTRLADIFKTDNLTLADKLIAEMGSDEDSPSFTNAAMQRGIDMEPVAKALYQSQTSYDILECGFIEHEIHSFIGMSPDGLIIQNDKYVGGLEIKCPDTSKHVQYIRHNKLPTEYRYQVLSMFLINPDCHFVDFISFDDRFKPKPIWYNTTFRTDIADELIKIEAEVLKFWDKVLKLQKDIIF